MKCSVNQTFQHFLGLNFVHKHRNYNMYEIKYKYVLDQVKLYVVRFELFLFLWQ